MAAGRVRGHDVMGGAGDAVRKVLAGCSPPESCSALAATTAAGGDAVPPHWRAVDWQWQWLPIPVCSRCLLGDTVSDLLRSLYSVPFSLSLSVALFAALLIYSLVCFCFCLSSASRLVVNTCVVPSAEQLKHNNTTIPIVPATRSIRPFPFSVGPLALKKSARNNNNTNKNHMFSAAGSLSLCFCFVVVDLSLSV